MRIFVAGTDTNVGKTIVSSWLCLHSRYTYYKPIQTGSLEGRDSDQVRLLADVCIQKESYLYEEPVSPHFASRRQQETIHLSSLQPLSSTTMIIEGAGGVLVPINSNVLMVDLIKYWALPVILVARSALGTINHTLLTLEALRLRDIPVLGVVITGGDDVEIAETIAFYGKTKILALMPQFSYINKEVLQQFPLGTSLENLLGVKK